MNAGIEVRRLGENDRSGFTEHLLGLDDDGLRCRFMGYSAPETRRAYADTMDLNAVLAFGSFMDGRLIGVAEVHPFGNEGRGEIAVSVEVSARGQGIGTFLIDKVLEAATQSGLLAVEARCMPLNGAMRALMRRRLAVIRISNPYEAFAEISLAA